VIVIGRRDVIKEHRLVREMSGEGRIKGRTVGLSILLYLHDHHRYSL